MPPSALRVVARLPLALAPFALAAVAGAQRPGPLGRVQPLRFVAAADFVADLSPDGPTLADSSRLALRDLELGGEAAIDALRLRAVILADGVGRVGVREASVGTTRGFLGFRPTVGRFLLPIGDLASAHRHSFATVEPPHALRRYLGELAPVGTGAMLQTRLGVGRLIRGAGDLEIRAGVVDRLVDDSGRVALDRPNRVLSGLGYVAQLRHERRLGRGGHALRVSASGMTGRRIQPLSDPVRFRDRRVDGVVARQTTVVAEFGVGRLGGCPASGAGGWGWCLAGQGVWQLNEPEPDLRGRIPRDPATGGPFYAGPTRDGAGGAVIAGMTGPARLELTLRADALRETDLGGGTTRAASATLERPFASGLRLGASYERLERAGRAAEHRVFARARWLFAVGETHRAP